MCVSVCTRQRDERVEWLYSGAAGASVNREEYLLGKKIDRHVDPMLAEEEREKEVITTAPLINKMTKFMMIIYRLLASAQEHCSCLLIQQTQVLIWQ